MWLKYIHGGMEGSKVGPVDLDSTKGLLRSLVGEEDSNRGGLWTVLSGDGIYEVLANKSDELVVPINGDGVSLTSTGSLSSWAKLKTAGGWAKDLVPLQESTLKTNKQQWKPSHGVENVQNNKQNLTLTCVGQRNFPWRGTKIVWRPTVRRTISTVNG